MNSAQQKVNPIGMVLRLYDTGMTVVPYEQSGSWFSCVVVDSGDDPKLQDAYPVGGYNIVVSAEDCAEAQVMYITSEPKGAASPDTPKSDAMIAELLDHGFDAQITWLHTDTALRDEERSVQVRVANVACMLHLDVDKEDCDAEISHAIQQCLAETQLQVDKWIDDVRSNPPYKC